MPESTRLAELRRLRASLQEHAAWLDREIAQEEQRLGVASSRPTASSDSLLGIATTTLEPSPLSASSEDAPLAFRPQPAGSPEVADAEAEQIMDEYRVAPTDVQRDVRKGCLLYFAAAMAAFALFVTVLYLALRH